MNALTRSLSLVALIACGGAETPDETPSGAVDDVAPAVVGSTPAAGAAGVAADAAVVIEFSEPMDAASVESQLDLTELGAATMSWNAAGDTLTLTPDADLDVVVAPADTVTAAADYRVVVGGDAADLAGNKLGTEYVVDFTTIRELWLLVPSIASLTRTVTPTDVAFEADDPLVVGDSDLDDGYRAALTFGLGLPGDPQEIVGATLRTVQMTDEIWGLPYTDLGTLTLDHVTYVDLDSENAINAAFNSSQQAARTFTGVASSPAQSDIAVDVFDAVQADWDEGRTETQFLLYFDGFTDLDGAVDRAVFSRDDLRLEVRWLQP